MRDIHCIPAYGRDYKSKAAVLADWKAGKDFWDCVSGQYLSARDFPAGYEKLHSDPGYPQVWVRYSRMAKIVRIV
jgi:hypothetical protein